MDETTNETTVASAPVVQPAAVPPAPAPVVPPAAKPPAPPAAHQSALHAHLFAVLHKLDEVKAFAIDGLKKLGVFVETEAPVVAGVAGAVASVIPGVGPAAAAVTRVVSTAAGVAGAVEKAVSGIRPAAPKR